MSSVFVAKLYSTYFFVDKRWPWYCLSYLVEPGSRYMLVDHSFSQHFSQCNGSLSCHHSYSSQCFFPFHMGMHPRNAGQFMYCVSEYCPSIYIWFWCPYIFQIHRKLLVKRRVSES